MSVVRLPRLAAANALHHDESQETDADRPATEEEINRITGESDRWIPSLDEWVLMLAIMVLLVAFDRLLR